MDRVLGGALLVFVAAAVLIGWGPAPGVTAWTTQAVLEAAFTTLSWQLAQRRGQGAQRRRFWEVAAVAGLILAAGAVLRAVESVTDPASANAVRTVPGILLTVGTGALLATMLARPWRVSRRERARLWLDMVTVLIGAAVAIWVVTVIGRSEADRPGQVVWAILGGVTVLVAAFALVRMVFTDSAPVRMLAGLTLSLAVALFGVDHVLNAEIAALPGHPRPSGDPDGAGAGPRGRRAVRTDPPPPSARPPRARRSGSRLPFLAVTATQALLVAELATNGLTIRTWGALVGSVVVTALVLVRQQLVLVDNERLVSRLDESVAALGRQEDELRYAASHDHLTGLANRAHFDERADRLEPGADQSRAVLLLDLNAVQGGQRHLGPSRRRRPAAGHRQPARRAACDPPTRRPGWAATSSACC